MNSRSMNSWLISYEKSRTEGIANILKGVKGRLSSSRWDLESMSWDEIRDLPVEGYGLDEGMTFGRTFESLRKSWHAYRLSRKQGFPAPDIALPCIQVKV